MKFSSIRPLAAAAVLSLCALPQAFAEGPVLKPGQVTEDALVDALTPGDDSPPQLTRSLRPTMHKPEAAKATSSGKANLLITFATGSSDLTPETVKTLEVVAKALQSDRLSGFVFRVEGHADPRGSAELNQKLSEERANAVVAYLSDKLGVPANRLSAVGLGASDPLDPGHPEAPENRRVTFVTSK